MVIVPCYCVEGQAKVKRGLSDDEMESPKKGNILTHSILTAVLDYGIVLIAEAPNHAGQSQETSI